MNASAVIDAVRHLRKPMDLLSWLGANRSDTRRYREDLQRRQGSRDAVLCAASVQRCTGFAPLWLAAVALCWSASAVAQGGAAAQPAAKTSDHAAGPARLSTLGNPKAGGRLLAREELRQCLRQQSDLAARKPPLEAERAGLDRERQQLLQADESLKADRAAIERLVEAATGLDKRLQELSAQVGDFNERVAKFQDSGRSGAMAERQRNELEREKTALDSRGKALEAERAALRPGAEQAVKSYDARAAARERAAADWNLRNASLTQTLQTYELELQNWKIDCEGRSYREDDEKAILSGK
jgi:predicted  nucleic acid-binding Zn-ribbon protein